MLCHETVGLGDFPTISWKLGFSIPMESCEILSPLDTISTIRESPSVASPFMRIWNQVPPETNICIYRYAGYIGFWVMSVSSKWDSTAQIWVKGCGISSACGICAHDTYLCESFYRDLAHLLLWDKDADDALAGDRNRQAIPTSYLIRMRFSACRRDGRHPCYYMELEYGWPLYTVGTISCLQLASPSNDPGSYYHTRRFDPHLQVDHLAVGFATFLLPYTKQSIRKRWDLTSIQIRNVSHLELTLELVNIQFTEFFLFTYSEEPRFSSCPFQAPSLVL